MHFLELMDHFFIFLAAEYLGDWKISTTLLYLRVSLRSMKCNMISYSLFEIKKYMNNNDGILL